MPIIFPRVSVLGMLVLAIRVIVLATGGNGSWGVLVLVDSN